MTFTKLTDYQSPLDRANQAERRRRARLWRSVRHDAQYMSNRAFGALVFLALVTLALIGAGCDEGTDRIVYREHPYATQDSTECVWHTARAHHHHGAKCCPWWGAQAAADSTRRDRERGARCGNPEIKVGGGTEGGY